MKVIGITGGIASGKSTVSNIFKQLDICVIDADVIAREIVEVGEPALNEIARVFGKNILTDKGELDRKKLGNLVFNDIKKLEILNDIMHPKIVKEIEKRLIALEKDGKHTLVLLDAALLVEMDMMGFVDEVWLVTTSEENQIKRVMSRDNLSRPEVIRRIRSQMPTKDKSKYADLIIENNGDLSELKDKVEQEISRLYNS